MFCLYRSSTSSTSTHPTQRLRVGGQTLLLPRVSSVSDGRSTSRGPLSQTRPLRNQSHQFDGLLSRLRIPWCLSRILLLITQAIHSEIHLSYRYPYFENMRTKGKKTHETCCTKTCHQIASTVREPWVVKGIHRINQWKARGRVCS